MSDSVKEKTQELFRKITYYLVNSENSSIEGNSVYSWGQLYDDHIEVYMTAYSDSVIKHVKELAEQDGFYLDEPTFWLNVVK